MIPSVALIVVSNVVHGGGSRSRLHLPLMPSSAARSDARGRPPGPLAGGHGGISGSGTAHNSSVTSHCGGEEARLDMTPILTTPTHTSQQRHAV